MEIDRRAFIASLGGTAAVSLMDSEAKADALEHWMEEQLDEQVAANQEAKFPTVAEIEAQIETRNYRRGAGSLFVSSARQRQEARADAEESDAPGFLPSPLRARQSRAAERDARAQDRHVRGSHPRLPAA